MRNNQSQRERLSSIDLRTCSCYARKISILPDYLNRSGSATNCEHTSIALGYGPASGENIAASGCERGRLKNCLCRNKTHFKRFHEGLNVMMEMLFHGRAGSKASLIMNTCLIWLPSLHISITNGHHLLRKSFLLSARNKANEFICYE